MTRRHSGMRQRRVAQHRRRREVFGAAFLQGPLDPLVEHADRLAVVGCFVAHGVGPGADDIVVVGRQRDDGDVLVAGFRSDPQFRGIKRVVLEPSVPVDEFPALVGRLCAGGEADECSVESASRLLYGSADNARRLGFSPHPDFELASHLLGEQPSSESSETPATQAEAPAAAPVSDVDSEIQMLADHCSDGGYPFLRHP